MIEQNIQVSSGFIEYLLEQLHSAIGEGEFIDKIQYGPHKKGDVLIHGHTHVHGVWQQADYTYINPGSTSTKLALYEDEKQLWNSNVHHPVDELANFRHINEQYEYRKRA